MDETIQDLKSPAKSKKMFIIIGVGVLALILLFIGLFFLFFNKPKVNTHLSETSNSNYITPTVSSSPTNAENESYVMWQLTEDGWIPMGEAPVCPNPLELKPPVDLSKVTSILYPGQTRGGNYKPHGGFRFDTITNNEVKVTAPMNATIVNGGRYLVDGEIQYTFDFIASCGIMYRLGHLRELDPKFQDIAETFPEAMEGDSRTNFVNPPVTVKEGDTIATQIGITQDGNTFVDFGVYDLRSKNQVSKNTIWASQHTSDLEQRAVCWFDLLSSEHEAIVRNLPPGDPTSGKYSDYCE